MAGGNRSKIKGTGAERELCGILGAAFAGSFIRVVGSGAFVGGKNVARLSQLSEQQIRHTKSDLVPPDFMPKFVIEAKFYADFPFHLLLTPGPIPLLDDWLGQLYATAKADDFAVLMMKFNRKSWFVVVKDNQSFTMNNHSVYEGKHGKFKITSLQDFLRNNHDLIKFLTA